MSVFCEGTGHGKYKTKQKKTPNPCLPVAHDRLGKTSIQKYAFGVSQQSGGAGCSMFSFLHRRIQNQAEALRSTLVRTLGERR